jgi:FkbM family methyltransferase
MSLLNRVRERGYRQASYAQCGEDLIVAFVLKAIGIDAPLYLDIGAYHPMHLSNTYLFYARGGHGVCVEPDRRRCERIRRARPRDVCLNIGVGLRDEVGEFFVMTSPTLSTFSGAEARRYESFGSQRIVAKEEVQVITVNRLLATYFERIPDFVSLDVEGLDLQILETLDFERFRPQVFCVETLTYDENKSERKIVEIIERMRNVGYLAFADTYINTVFVDKASWERR